MHLWPRKTVLVPLAALLACTKAGPEVRAEEPAASPGSPAPSAAVRAAPVEHEKVQGLDVAGMDFAVQPGDDFFAYANGTWIKNTEIPPDRSTYGVSAVLDELTSKRTADLIAETAQGEAPAGSEARKIGDYYATFMDEAAIEAKGTAPLKPALDYLYAIKDARGLARALGQGLRADVDALNATNFFTTNFLGLWVAQDLIDPSRYAPFLFQGGLGMPDRDYYLDPSPRMADIRTKYQEHIANVLKLAGLAGPTGADATAQAARIFEHEVKIAQAHVSRVVSEDVEKGNNHWSREELLARAPGLDWSAFLMSAGLDSQPMFVVWQPSAITALSALVRAQPLKTWKEYLAFRAVERAASFLTKAFADEQFAFYGTVLNGTPTQRARWKRAVAATDNALGEAVGKLYVARYFPPAEKVRAEEMVKNEVRAFARRIDALDWMAPQTKAKAKAKLAALKVGVGYPDKWRDYTGLEIIRGDALGNDQRASLFDYKRALARFGQPVDRGEWVMNPQLVNAVNLPAMNALNFPAALLQPPDFDPSRPTVMDYGSAGSVIGHEISHSFDDQGALFDSTGKLENWWTKEDFAHFNASSEQLIKQYDAYRPFPDLAVNGKLTISENIADVAGLSVAYDAYRLAQGRKEAPTVSGLTGDQQFFIAFAQSWRHKAREPAARQRIMTDGHAPAQYRVDTVRNLDAWYLAFGVQQGEKLALTPGDRVRVW